MARLPRLAVQGQAHLVVHRAHHGQAIFAEPQDLALAVQCLLEALRDRRVALHAYAFLRDRVWLLLTPSAAGEMGRTLQAFGRAYTAGFNRRHDGTGSVWAGRYRGTVVEPGSALRDALLFVEQSPVRAGLAASAGDWPWSSAAHHLGTATSQLISPAQSYWALGNTPFDRAAAYALLMSDPLSQSRQAEIAWAAERGWALGSPTFLAQLGQETSRPLQPRRRGRPRSSSGTVKSVPK